MLDLSLSIASQKMIVCFADNMERAGFFTNFFGSLGREHIMLTNKLTVKICYPSTILIPTVGGDTTSLVTIKNLTKLNNDWIQGRIKLSQVRLLYGSISTAIEENTSGVIDLIVIWNGFRSHDRCLVEYAKTKSIPVRFMEQSNFDGKLIIDPKGINHLNSFVPSRQEKEIDIQNFRKLLLAHLTSKPPQSKTKVQKIIHKFLRIADFVSASVIRTPQTSYLPLRKKLNIDAISSIFKMKSQYFCDGRAYIVFVSQVEGDSSLNVASKVTRDDGLRVAIQIAEREDYGLQIANHPADSNKYSYTSPLLQGITCAVKICDGTSEKLLRSAKKVILINSTVGLFAKILDLKLTQLGESWYRDLTISEIYSYYHHYLVHLNYFQLINDTVEIKEELQHKILERLGIE